MKILSFQGKFKPSAPKKYEPIENGPLIRQLRNEMAISGTWKKVNMTERKIDLFKLILLLSAISSAVFGLLWLNRSNFGSDTQDDSNRGREARQLINEQTESMSVRRANFAHDLYGDTPSRGTEN